MTISHRKYIQCISLLVLSHELFPSIPSIPYKRSTFHGLTPLPIPIFAPFVGAWAGAQEPRCAPERRPAGGSLRADAGWCGAGPVVERSNQRRLDGIYATCFFIGCLGRIGFLASPTKMEKLETRMRGNYHLSNLSKHVSISWEYYSGVSSSCSWGWMADKTMKRGDILNT